MDVAFVLVLGNFLDVRRFRFQYSVSSIFFFVLRLRRPLWLVATPSTPAPARWVLGLGPWDWRSASRSASGASLALLCLADRLIFGLYLTTNPGA
jgi:hypothetical protein